MGWLTAAKAQGRSAHSGYYTNEAETGTETGAAAPRAHAREAKGTDATARRLRAALMNQHQGLRYQAPATGQQGSYGWISSRP